MLHIYVIKDGYDDSFAILVDTAGIARYLNHCKVEVKFFVFLEIEKNKTYNSELRIVDVICY